MPFHGNSQFIIGTTILHQRRINWEDYQQQSVNRIAVLQNDWRDILKDFIRPLVNQDAWNQIYSKQYMFDIHVNPMQDVINKVAKLYTQPPSREYIVNDTKSDAYESMIEPATKWLNNIMDESLKFSMACGGTVIRIGVGTDGKWFFQNLIPDQFVPIPNPNDPTKLSGIKYNITDKSNLQDMIRTTYTFVILDLENPIYLEEDNSGKVIKDLSGAAYPWRGIDRIPYLPLVYARLDNSTNELVNMSMGVDLYNAALFAGWLEVQKEWLIRHQSHKQIIITGMQKEISEMGNQVIDPTTPIAMGGIDKGEIDIKTMDLTSDPKRYSDEQLNILESEASKRGYMKSDFVASAQKSTFEALMISKEQRDEFISSMSTDFKLPETEIASVMIKLNNTMNLGEKIPEDGEFTIKYARGQDWALVTALGLTAESLVSMGIKTKAQLLMLFDRNINSEAEAQTIIEDNIKANKKTEPEPDEPEIPEPIMIDNNVE